MRNKLNRQGNMELLRIFSMLLIIIHHLVYNSLDWKTSIISGGKDISAHLLKHGQ